MAYTISVDDNQIIYVKFTGEVEIKERQEARNEVISLCKLKWYDHVMLDMRDCNMQFDMNDIVNYVDSTSSHEIIQDLRISGITNPKDKVNDFIQHFLSTKGINIRFFYFHEEALEWLCAI